jgi:hypothetical protein
LYNNQSYKIIFYDQFRDLDNHNTQKTKIHIIRIFCLCNFDSKMISSEINTNQWIRNDHNFITSTNTDSSLIPKLPASLAAPAGWRSEIIHSNSPIPTDLGTNTYTNSYEEYNTTNTSQIPSRYISNSNEYLDTSIGENSAYQQQSTGGHSAYHQQSIGENSAYHQQSLGGNLAYEQQLIGENSAYEQRLLGRNSAYQQQSIFTEQQQQNIINNVEHQNPPPLILRKTLPNNLVTYQQNISVRYLQPPSPPPSGTIIIRNTKTRKHFLLKIFLSFR